MKTKVFEALNKDGEAVTFHVVATFDLNGRYYVFYTDMQKMYVGYYETKKIKNISFWQLKFSKRCDILIFGIECVFLWGRTPYGINLPKIIGGIQNDNI